MYHNKRIVLTKLTVVVLLTMYQTIRVAVYYSCTPWLGDRTKLLQGWNIKHMSITYDFSKQIIRTIYI